MTKFYFLAPTRDSPPDGPIVLGSLIASPNNPEDAINGTAPPAFLDPKAPYEAYQTNWSSEREKYFSGSGGIWASFLQFAGLGGDLSITASKSDKDIFQFQKLVTKYFVPNTKYVREAVKDPDVDDFLRKTKYRDSLYMITGVKIAIGATVTKEKMRERGVYAQFGVDLTATMGMPIQFGPKGDFKKGQSEKESSSEMSDFIFAFRLRKIRFKKGEIVHEDYTKHALYSNTEPANEGDEEQEMVVDGLAEEAETAAEVGIDSAASAIDDEDGEVCSVLTPEQD